MVDSKILRWTSLKTMTRVGGTVRWQAPELMSGSEDDTTRPTFSADVYSVASVMYEVIFLLLCCRCGAKKTSLTVVSFTGVH